MKTVTITSQGQITIPIAIRRAWNIKGSEELQVSFNPETKRMIIEKPLEVDEFLKIADEVAAKIPKGIKPLQGAEIGEFYRASRTQEIVDKFSDGVKK
ncbi:MAG: AbrB/MazE/SpoVT family DNA-binding domain-containing protein [Candidatus Nanosyncoccaceae bacterium]|jgi:AbrB family looped-hinge helix DNA binding protein